MTRNEATRATPRLTPAADRAEAAWAGSGPVSLERMRRSMEGRDYGAGDMSDAERRAIVMVRRLRSMQRASRSEANREAIEWALAQLRPVK